MTNRILRFRQVLGAWTLSAAAVWSMLAASLASGCADAPPDPNGPSEVNLAQLLPPGAQPVGVTVSPEGKRYVLDRLSGLYELGPGAATLVFKTADLAVRYGQPADLDLTDVVALGSEQFAITAENDGFRLDLHGGTFASYFCYVPSIPADPEVVPMSISQTLQLQGIQVKQRTESVSYSPESQLLFAQPRTIRMDTGAVAGSEVFVFPSGGGEPSLVRPLPDPSFVAEGMAALSGGRLLLGSGNSLYVMGSGDPLLVKTLSTSVQIAGLARQSDGSVLVLDGAARRLLTIPAL